MRGACRSISCGPRDLKGLLELRAAKKIDGAYVITEVLDDIGAMTDISDVQTRIMKIPAPMLCYWMGQVETPGGASWDEYRTRMG